MYRFLFLILLLSASTSLFAQRQVRKATREGNSLYHKEDYLNAEIKYRKALDVNAADSLAIYNLGNALFRQQQDEKAQEALRQFVNAAQQAQKGGNRQLAAKAFYNAGDVCMAAQQYQEAINFYKRSLRNNPLDDEARYNLLLAQKLLQQQQDENQDQDQNEDQQQDQQQQQQEQQQDQQQDQNQDQDQQDQDQNQDQQNPPQDQQQDQQQQPQQMSQEQAEAILNANNRDEQDTQEKVQQKQMQQMQRRKTDKDW